MLVCIATGSRYPSSTHHPGTSQVPYMTYALHYLPAVLVDPTRYRYLVPGYMHKNNCQEVMSFLKKYTTTLHSTSLIYRIIADNGTRNFVNLNLKITVFCQDLQVEPYLFHVHLYRNPRCTVYVLWRVQAGYIMFLGMQPACSYGELQETILTKFSTVYQSCCSYGRPNKLMVTVP